ncbi:MAG: hypothetical protein OEY78_13320 [Gammaproteobacteria bacterium]|nr:hypothetical protein [Gammaproteobacteria bacterium]
MPSKIENLTNKPLWLTLNSGRSINVAATIQSETIEQSEIEGNEKLKKLESDGVVLIHPGRKEKPAVKQTTDVAAEQVKADDKKGKAGAIAQKK